MEDRERLIEIRRIIEEYKERRRLLDSRDYGRRGPSAEIVREQRMDRFSIFTDAIYEIEKILPS